jgi:O-antigen/teichoic acid export membrane protein
LLRLLYFEWIYLAFKSNASLGSGHFHFLKAFRVLIENGTFSQTTGAIWAFIIGTICGILSYIALYFKEKCFKGSLNTLFFKKQGIKIYANPTGYILSSIFLVCQESSDIFKMLHDPFVSEFKNLCR